MAERSLRIVLNADGQQALQVLRALEDQAKGVTTEVVRTDKALGEIGRGGALEELLGADATRFLDDLGAAEARLQGLKATTEDGAGAFQGLSGVLPDVASGLADLQAGGSGAASVLTGSLLPAIGVGGGILLGLTAVIELAPAVVSAFDDMFVTAAERAEEADERMAGVYNQLVDLSGEEFDITARYDSFEEARIALASLRGDYAGLLADVDRYVTIGGQYYDVATDRFVLKASEAGRALKIEIDNLKADAADLNAFIGDFEEDLLERANRARQSRFLPDLTDNDDTAERRRQQRDAERRQRERERDARRASERRAREAQRQRDKQQREAEQRRKENERKAQQAQKAFLRQQGAISLALLQGQAERETEAIRRSRDERLGVIREAVKRGVLIEADAARERNAVLALYEAELTQIRLEEIGRRLQDDQAARDVVARTRRLEIGESIADERDRTEALAAAEEDRLERELRARRDALLEIALLSGLESEAAEEAVADALDAELTLSEFRAAEARRRQRLLDEDAQAAADHAARLQEIAERAAVATGAVDARAQLRQRLEYYRADLVAYAALERSKGRLSREELEERRRAEVAFAETQLELYELERDRFDERVDLVRSYAEDVVGILRDALDASDRLSDDEIASVRDRLDAEEEALRASLARQQTTREAFDRDLRDLNQERADFELELARRNESALSKSIKGVAQLAIEEGARELTAWLATQAVRLAFGKAAIEATTQAQVASGAKIAAAQAPAAAATSITSFGTAAIVGGAAALATIGAIIGALVFEGGGWVGRRGEAGRDTVPAFLGRGEAVINRHQQVPIERALFATYGYGLDELFRREQRPHYLASGGFAEVAARQVEIYRVPRLLPTPEALSSGLDLGPVVAEVRALRGEIATGQRSLDRTIREVERMKASPVQVAIGPSEKRRLDRVTASDSARRSSARPATLFVRRR